jgi:hypothetical protein
MLTLLVSTSRFLIRLSLTLFLACCSLNVFAQTATCNKPTVFFVNGVWNFDPKDAQDGSQELTKAITERFAPYGVQVRAIYNPGDGVLADIAEVAVTQEWLRKGLDFVTAVVNSEFPKIAAWLQQQIDDAAAKTRRRATVDGIKKKVLDEIKGSAAPVILIAHSQGNIMVNDAVIELKTDPTT